MSEMPSIDEQNEWTADDFLRVAIERGSKLSTIGMILLEAHLGTEKEKAAAFDKIVVALWPKTKGSVSA